MKEEKTGEESAERCSSPALGAVHWALSWYRRGEPERLSKVRVQKS